MTYKEIRDLIGKVLALEAKIAALPTTDDGYLIGDEADDYEEFSEQMAIMAPPLARELQRLLAEHADGAWVFAADLRRALEGKEAVSNDPLVLEVQNLRTAYADALADADASQHWRTRALRAEAALEETRAALRLATDPKPDDLLGVRLVNGCAGLPDDTPSWVADLFREAWTAIRVLRRDAEGKAARIASLDEEIEGAYQMLREGLLAGPLVTGRTEVGLRVRDRLLGWVFTSFAAELERSDAPNNLSISMTPDESHAYANYRLDLCIARPECPSAHEQNVALRADVERLRARLDVMETERNEARDERDDLAEQIAAIGTWIDARTDAPRTADSGQPLTLVQRLSATRAEFIRVREKRDAAQDLVSSAIANAGRHAARPLWSHIMHLFAVGSTRAHALCAEYGYHPEQEVGPSTRPQRKA